MIRHLWHTIRGHQVLATPVGYDGLTWGYHYTCSCGDDWSAW